MLITFSCDAYENITMFGSVAKKLLHLMGHSGTTPGAILTEDVPEALARLQAGIAQDTSQTQTMPSDEDEPEISLAHRAIPLIALLTAAAKDKCNVMWA